MSFPDKHHCSNTCYSGPVNIRGRWYIQKKKNNKAYFLPSFDLNLALIQNWVFLVLCFMSCSALSLRKKGKQKKRFVSHIKAGIIFLKKTDWWPKLVRWTKEMNKSWVFGYRIAFGLDRHTGCKLNVYWFRYPI